MKKNLCLLVFLLCGTIYYLFNQDVLMSNNTNFTLTSQAFSSNQAIPSAYTCEGADISPQLSWSGAPNGTKNFVLILDDPDAQSVSGKTFVHWIVINIPTEISDLPEAAIINFGHAQELLNDFGKTRYGGPCPPNGKHHYHFTLFALNEVMELNQIKPPLKIPFTAEQFRSVMKKFIIGEAQLIGTFTRFAR